jgi:hypothetical protein
MAEHVQINRVSHVGVGHVEEFTGDRLDTTVDGTGAVIRRYVDGKLASVHTRTRIDCVDWYPEAPKGSNS